MNKTKTATLLLFAFLSLVVPKGSGSNILTNNKQPQKDDHHEQPPIRRRRKLERQGQEDENDVINEQPKLIVHIGPHKTGTSTIQSVLTKLDYTYDVLHQDNLYYMGKVDGVEKAKDLMHYDHEQYGMILQGYCLNEIALGLDFSDRCKKEVARVTALVKDHYEQGHNIIVSNEDIETFLPFLWGEGSENKNIVWYGLGDDETNATQRMIDLFVPVLGEYWKTQSINIMFVYRRFFEWHFSRYKEHGKDFLEAFGEESNYGKDVDLGWKHPEIQKGYHSYPEQINMKSFLNEKKFHSQRFNPIYFHRKLPEYLHESQITMVNMYQSDDYVQEFVCHTIPIPSTNHSCEYVRTHRESFNNARVRDVHDLNYATIAREAHFRFGESISNCYSPPTLFQTISKFHTNALLESATSDNDNLLFETICISSKDQDWLLKQSIEDEIELFPEYHYHNGGEEALQSSFQKFVDNHKFCTIDMDALFSDEEYWKPFFESLVQNCTSGENS